MGLGYFHCGFIRLSPFFFFFCFGISQMTLHRTSRRSRACHRSTWKATASCSPAWLKGAGLWNSSGCATTASSPPTAANISNWWLEIKSRGYVWRPLPCQTRWQKTGSAGSSPSALWVKGGLCVVWMELAMLEGVSTRVSIILLVTVGPFSRTNRDWNPWHTLMWHICRFGDSPTYKHCLI